MFFHELVEQVKLCFSYWAFEEQIPDEPTQDAYTQDAYTQDAYTQDAYTQDEPANVVRLNSDAIKRALGDSYPEITAGGSCSGTNPSLDGWEEL
jgi:hypothetical protein